MFAVRQILKMTAQQLVFPVWYGLFSHGKVRDGSVLFADAHHNERPGNMEALYQAILEDGTYDVTELYLDYQEAPWWRVILSGLKFMRLYARTQTVILCDNFLPAASCRCRKETLVVQLWHACGAYKKFGYDAADDIPPMYKGHVFRNTRLVTVSAPACVEPFAGAMRLNRKYVRSTGVCRTDMLLSEAWRRDAREQFRRAYPQAEGKKVAVIAPTFRGNAAQPEEYQLDAGRLAADLGEDYFLIVCPHPHMKQMKSGDSAAQAWLSRVDTQILYAAADVFVTDYSSLIFEYLLFDKPLILYVPDLDRYREERGFYLDVDEIPARMVRSGEALAGSIREACGEAEPGSESGEADEAKRKTFLAKYMSACDGGSTQRVLKLIGRFREKSTQGRKP